MSDEIEVSGSGGGCVLWLILVMLAVIGFAVVQPNTTTSTSTNTTTNTTSVLSNNELMSRNQLNIFSTVHNYYGAQAGQTNTTMTGSNNTTSTDITTQGDRSPIYSSQGVRLCWDDRQQLYTDIACQGTPTP